MSKEVSEEPEHARPKDYSDPPPAPLFDFGELRMWSFYRALIAEFVATLLFLYITVATVIGYKVESAADQCGGVGVLGIAWAFGGMIFILVYCTAGISGGHINPAVTFGLLLARKVSVVRAVLYIVAQCLGGIVGVGIVKGIMKDAYNGNGGGANMVATGYSRGTALGAEIIGTFVLVYTVFSATDPKRSARDSHVPVRARAAANRIRRVHGAPGHHPHHRHRHQPGKEPRRRRHLQPEEGMGRPLDLLGGPARRSAGRGGVPPVHPPGGGHQGARLLSEQPEQLSRPVNGQPPGPS